MLAYQRHLRKPPPHTYKHSSQIHKTYIMLASTSSIARVGLLRASTPLVARRTLTTTPRMLSARPDTASGFREDKAHGPIPGAHPSPEINVARTRSTLRVLAPSVAVMFVFIGWWFFGHNDRDHRKNTIDVGPMESTS